VIGRKREGKIRGRSLLCSHKGTPLHATLGGEHRTRLLLQPIQDKRRDRNQHQEHYPHPPGEHVVVMQKPAPRLPYHHSRRW